MTIAAYLADQISSLRMELDASEIIREHTRRQRDRAREDLLDLKIKCFEETIPALRAKVERLTEALAELIDDAMSANRPSQSKVNRMRRIVAEQAA